MQTSISVHIYCKSMSIDLVWIPGFKEIRDEKLWNAARDGKIDQVDTYIQYGADLQAKIQGMKMNYSDF